MTLKQTPITSQLSKKEIFLGRYLDIKPGDTWGNGRVVRRITILLADDFTDEEAVEWWECVNHFSPGNPHDVKVTILEY